MPTERLGICEHHRKNAHFSFHTKPQADRIVFLII